MKRIVALLAVALVLTGCNGRLRIVWETQPSTPAVTAPTTTAPTTAPATEPTETAMDTQPIAPPQAYVEVFREGESSQIPVQIIHGTVGDYTIAMDPEYFTFYAQETVDLFLYEDWEGTQAVAYSISDYADDVTPEEFIGSMATQFGHLYDSYTADQTTIGAFDATVVCFSDYKEDPAYQMHAYLLDCNGNYYLIEATFVFEMYEGLYAIMCALFDTFMPV